VTDAKLIVALANACAARRPPGAPGRVAHDSLADAGSASEQLGHFLGTPIKAQELSEVRALQRAVATIVAALIDGARAPLDALNALAAQEPAICTVSQAAHGDLSAGLRPRRATASATLLLAVIRELGELDRSRLRRCARRECGLVFYDLTRSATQRWHAERPCGLRERQRRYRVKRAG
jgi:predicted RNA-binding Zn ribbon-like protein